MTAVMRCAEACFSASMVMSNSMMPSETGEHEGCTTNTSASRTFSSIWTNMFSFEKRMTLERPSGKPICEQIALGYGQKQVPVFTCIRERHGSSTWAGDHQR